VVRGAASPNGTNVIAGELRMEDMMERRRRGNVWIAGVVLMVASSLGACGGGVGVSAGTTTTTTTTAAEASAGPREAPSAEQSAGGCTATDRDATTAAWNKVRADHPFHLQAIALSPPFRSGCRAMIIAEPPPKVTMQALRDLAPELLAGSESRKHVIGYDGWTQDVVVTLPPVSDRDLAELVAQLHSLLFDTTYRMATLDTSQSIPAYNPAATPLDVAIGPGELRRWLLQQSSVFTPLLGGTPVSFKILLSSDEPGVYVDEMHGLVAWIIPRRADIAGMAALVRQFALESDVIVGAIASSQVVAVLARQRLIDPSVLPPLRFETVSLLAAVHEKAGLAQSYERKNPLASKVDDVRDWAPIYLSPELHDTEYGSLLNIADQFLKQWSNN
jgi:hypothetical protein